MASEEQNNGWVSVHDRLPENGQKVLIVYNDYYDWYTYPTSCNLAYFRAKSLYERWFQHNESLFPIDSDNITHWMPLPTGPANKNNNDN